MVRIVTVAKYCATAIGGLVVLYLAYVVISGIVLRQELQSQVTEKVDVIATQLKDSPTTPPGGGEDTDKIVKNISSSTAFGTLGITAAPPQTPPPAPK
jgi:hypothetical protein